MGEPFRALIYRCPDPRCGWWDKTPPQQHRYGQCPAYFHKNAQPLDGLRLGRDSIPLVRSVWMVAESVMPWYGGEDDSHTSAAMFEAGAT